jgi:hypothetical protein
MAVRCRREPGFDSVKPHVNKPDAKSGPDVT